MFVLDSYDFPLGYVESLMKCSAPSDSRVISHLLFEHEICHECNSIVPGKTYCAPMYGGRFKQKHGWYINKQAYIFGIDPKTKRMIQELCPKEILDIVKLEPELTIRKYNEMKMSSSWDAHLLWKNFKKQERKVWKIIENEVRLRFGHKRVGEGWSSETILYYIVKSIFPNMTIHRHFRPDFLQGLELDIFINELNIGIEYQGVQHFQPVKHWGGEEGLKKRKSMDRKKKRICKRSGIKLIYFKYDENLGNETVHSKILNAPVATG